MVGMELQDPPERQVPRGTLVGMELQDPLERQVLRGTLVGMELLDPLERQGPLVWRDSLEWRDRKARKV